MDYWLAGTKERVHLTNQHHEDSFAESHLTAQEYTAGSFALGFLGRRGRERAVRLAGECGADPQEFLAFLEHLLEVARLDKHRAPKGLYPALDTYSDLPKRAIWRGFNGCWLHWQTMDLDALILLSVRGGLAGGTLLLCRECGKLAARDPVHVRQELCSKCGAERSIKERRLKDPIKKTWDRAYQRFWQRLQAEAISYDEWEEWKRVAKSYLKLVESKVWSLDEWQAQCVDNWPLTSSNIQKEPGGT